MRPSHFIGTWFLFGAVALSVPGLAAAEDAQGFVEHEHQNLARLLREPDSSQRETELSKALSSFVDYDELTKRAFGDPCPAAEPSCENLWAGYTDAQRTELRGLLEQLIRRNYERNLKKTLDFDVSYRGAKDLGGDTKVMTEAKNLTKAYYDQFRRKMHDPNEGYPNIVQKLREKIDKE